jgi:ATP-dependent DNA helicase RecG
VIFGGVDDPGNCARRTITEELPRSLADMRSDGNIVPCPSMVVEERRSKGCEVTVVIVHPSQNPPARCRGRVGVRVGPRRAVSTAEEERQLIERRHSGLRPFDIDPVPAATPADSDLDLFQRVYVPRAVDPEIGARNDRGIQEQRA